MIKSGLVSITFRKLSPQEIVSLCVETGLAGIEWGGDVHCPHGDVAAANEIRKLTADAGLETPAYGSYYRLNSSEEEELSFDCVLASAVALETPYIRVWAGRVPSSADADEDYWKRAVENLRQIADKAMKQKIGITLEYHQNTLTDSIESTDRLLRAIDHSNVFVNWQPTNFKPFEYSLEALETVLPWMSNLHVFRWDYQGDKKIRRPLEEGIEDWRRYFELATTKPGDRFALLEFVKDDDPDQLRRDAKVLNDLLSAAND